MVSRADDARASRALARSTGAHDDPRVRAFRLRTYRVSITHAASSSRIGIDVDRAILDDAQRLFAKTGQRATWIVARAEELPIAGASCELVVSSIMLHHLPTPAKRAALLEWRRVLGPRGRLLLFDLGVPRSWPARILLWPLRFGILEEQADNLRGLVPALLRDAGFAADEIGVYGSVVVGYRAVVREPPRDG